MLKAIRSKDRAKVYAFRVEKAEAPFFCPECGEHLVVRKGQKKIHHFAHHPGAHCRRLAGESYEHLLAKQAIFESLVRYPFVTDLELEKNLGCSVADVYAKIYGAPVAVEIQKSYLSIEDIRRRTLNYHKLGIAVLWAGLWRDELSFSYVPELWEKWCHAAYYGKVYYWREGETFLAVNYRKYKMPDGRFSGTAFRNPVVLKTVQLTKDFEYHKRRAWVSDSGSVDIPDCTLCLSDD